MYHFVLFIAKGLTNVWFIVIESTLDMLWRSCLAILLWMHLPGCICIFQKVQQTSVTMLGIHSWTPLFTNFILQTVHSLLWKLFIGHFYLFDIEVILLICLLINGKCSAIKCNGENCSTFFSPYKFHLFQSILLVSYWAVKFGYQFG